MRWNSWTVSFFQLMLAYFASVTFLFANSEPPFRNTPLPEIRIGVLAYRPKPQTLEQWRPLANHLNKTIPNYNFVIEALSYRELNEAVEQKKLDFTLTNSGHYVLLRKLYGLSSPLSTLAVLENGQTTTSFGGVIFSKNSNRAIQQLTDIKGKTIAVADTESLGGYQMQTYELHKIGLELPKDASLLITDMPHDNVVKMVLSGRADIGFVRTGVLEKMANEHKINMNDIKIINAQTHLNFPAHLSTRLYPEWPLSALPHVNEKLSRMVASVVFKLEEDSIVTQAMQIHGFNIPADYGVVDEMLRELRFPPYNFAPRFYLNDIWDKYSVYILALGTLSVFILVFILLKVWRQNLELKDKKWLYDKLSSHTRTVHWEVTPEGMYTYISPNVKDLLGYEAYELIHQVYFYMLRPHEEREVFKQTMFTIFDTQQPFYNIESRLVTKDGHMIWVLAYGFPIFDSNGALKGYRGSNMDITEQKVALDALKESEARFKALHNASFGGIAIHDKGLILDCNQGLATMSGYSIDELIGFNGLLLINEKTRLKVIENIAKGYEKPYDVVCVHKNGTEFPIRIQGKEIPYKGKNVRVVEFRDISEEKKAHEKLLLAASVFETAREGIVITDPHGNIIDVNESFTHITGYSRDEVLGKNPKILNSGRHSQEFYEAMWRSIITKEHWYGEIWNRRKNGEIYAQMLTITAIRNPSDHRINHYVALFSDITAIKAHEHQLQHIAHHDALTNLPNRLLLADRLNQGMIHARRRSQTLVVAYLDLDGFKAINDLYGHEVGDKLLIALAQQMKNTLREGDTLARMGGDEFVAVFQDIETIETSIPILKRLLEAAAVEVTIDDLFLHVSASLGVTFYPQSEELDADQLLRQADQAMYQAKLAGKNRYHIFDAIEDKTVRSYHENLETIRHALEARQFVLYYQPKVHMRTGLLVGVEALIRWRHPELGILPPSAFLPTIEQHPLSIDIGQWVIEEALCQIERWKSMGYTIAVSVNVGARQLQEYGFIDFMKTSLQAHPSVEPSLLSLEILETSALEDLTHISHLMKECLLLGIQFSMDDFGTGYSSLTYLKQLPVSLLKIDQSFVRDMLENSDDLSILKGILGLASAFNSEVIAEGVETIEHGELLLMLGCEFAQGYGIAHPMPPEELPLWLATWKPHSTWLTLSAVGNEHFTLLLAMVEHYAWVKSVEHYITGVHSILPILKSNACRFSALIESRGLPHYTKTGLKTLKKLHVEVHELAETLCTYKEKEEESKAREGLIALHVKSELLRQAIKKLAFSKVKVL